MTVRPQRAQPAALLGGKRGRAHFPEHFFKILMSHLFLHTAYVVHWFPVLGSISPVHAAF